MARSTAHANALQAELPRFRRDGSGHARGCQCPRCRRWLAQADLEREAAERLLRKADRERVKSLARQMAFEAAERDTDRFLAEQAARLSRLAEDSRLDELLALRRAGKAPSEALAALEGPAPRRGPQTPRRSRPDRLG